MAELAPSRAPSTELGLQNSENVSWQSFSLRQHVHAKHSPLAFERAQKPNNGGPSCENLRTARQRLRPKILSLRPFVSKPPDFADLVRNS